MNKTIFIVFSVILSFSLTSCALTKFAGHYKSVDKKSGRLNGQVYTTNFNSYRIGILSNDWKRINIKGGDLAFYNSSFDASITTNSTCQKEKRRYSLKALSNSLVTGIKNKEIKIRENIKVDLSQGLYSQYSAELNNENIALATVVYKSEKCNYDFSYSSTYNKFEKNLPTFKNFISSFNEINAK
ncbi:MAG: hypothetical protein ACRENO_00845 [Thermodesulfobacteriota bacterium]